MERLEEARRTLRPTFEELMNYRRSYGALMFRNACEKNWLTMVVVMGALMTFRSQLF